MISIILISFGIYIGGRLAGNIHSPNGRNLELCKIVHGRWIVVVYHPW